MEIDQSTPLDFKYFSAWEFCVDETISGMPSANLTLAEIAHAISAKAATIVTEQIIQDVAGRAPSLHSDIQGNAGICVTLLEDAAHLVIPLAEIDVSWADKPIRDAIAGLLARIDAAIIENAA